MFGTSDGECNGDGVRVELCAGVARVAAGVVDLSLSDLQRLVRVVLGDVRARAELDLLAVQQPGDPQPALLQLVGRSVAVQCHVTADRHRLVRRRHDYRRLLCASATHTHTLCLT